MDEDEKQEMKEEPTGEEQKMEVKKEEEEEGTKNRLTENEIAVVGKSKPEPEMGRLVMTINGQQKQLPFAIDDLLSTATMLDGDKVRRWRPSLFNELISSWIFLFLVLTCLICEGAIQHHHPSGDQRGTCDLCGNSPRVL